MARDDVHIVRHTALPPIPDAVQSQSVLNRMGMQIVVDFFDQMVLSGFAYHMQAGTENAGINSTEVIDDVLVWMIADNAVGKAMIPLLYECTPGVIGGATLAMAMLEVDKAKLRYSSGGTTYVPANLRGDDPNGANGVFKIIAGAGIVALAKTPVPDSVELARKDFIENVLTDTLGYPGAWDTEIYSIRRKAMCIITDASSIVGHFGAASADVVGYGVLQFAQLDKAQVT